MSERALALVPNPDAAAKRKRAGDNDGDNDALLAPGSVSDPSLALVVPATGGPAITKAEYEKRLKDADELEQKLAFITHNVPTIVSNVQGSAAGAGSGTFHTYANGRRREAERVERMEREARERAAKAEMETRLSTLQRAEEEKTAKRRGKRQKQKNKKLRKGSAGGGDGGPASDGEEEEKGAGAASLAVADLD